MSEDEMKRLALLAAVVALVLGCDKGDGPEIMPLDDRTVRVTDSLTIDLIIDNAQGDEIWDFAVPALPEIEDNETIARIFSSGGAAMFRFVPLASHAGRHQVTFMVTNSRGSDSETINVTVELVEGVPQFIQPPPGDTYDLSEDPCVDVDIEVMDEDSTHVDIREGEPRVVGGQMSQTGAFTAHWRWCPTPRQVDASLTYSLRLLADDGENAPVPKTFFIVLLPESGGRTDECPGEPPRIAELTPPPPDILETERPYEINATITDDLGLKDLPILRYSIDSPDLNGAGAVTIPFEELGGDDYRAYVPNEQLDEGLTRTIYYRVSAIDDDDREGRECDHETESAVNQVTVAAGADYVAYCERCSNDDHCREGLCVASVAETAVAVELSFCGRDCVDGCSEGTCVEIVRIDRVRGGQCVPEGMICASEEVVECTDDEWEELSDSVSSAPTYTLGSLLDGWICPYDDDYYAVHLEAGSEYDLLMLGDGETEADLDVALLDATEMVLSSSTGMTSEEAFLARIDTSGTYFIHVFGFWGARGGYSFEMVRRETTSCEDDENEENDERASAAPLSCGEGAYGVICSDDDDWYWFSVSAPTTIRIDTICDESAGDLDLELRDSSDVRLSRSTSLGCEETMTATLPDTGPFFVRVHGYEGDEGNYALDCVELD